MKMCIEKIGMIRPQHNIKSQELDLAVDWSVDFENDTAKIMGYVCKIKTSKSFPLNLQIEGILNSDDLENFSKTEVSQVIFSKCLEILLNLLNLSKEHFFEIQEKVVSKGKKGTFLKKVNCDNSDYLKLTDI
ncbi:MAG: pilus assembly protein [Methanobrevibacter sp. CfCl-M3]